MKTENNVGVALVKRACPICAKTEDAEIVLNTRLTPSAKQEVEDLHQQVIGYSEKPCPQCTEMTEKGFVIIGIIEEKTEDERNPFRSGHLWCVTKDYATRVFGDVAERGAAFVDIKLAQQHLGLPLNLPVS